MGGVGGDLGGSWPVVLGCHLHSPYNAYGSSAHFMVQQKKQYFTMITLMYEHSLNMPCLYFIMICVIHIGHILFFQLKKVPIQLLFAHTWCSPFSLPNITNNKG